MILSNSSQTNALLKPLTCWWEYVRITEKSRLATAAAAIKHRIVIRRSPLVFLPVLPWKKGSATVAVIVVVNEGKFVVGSLDIC
jgi:hypothetical protein